MFCPCRDSNRSLDIFDEKKHPLSVCWRVKWHNYGVTLCWFTDNDQPSGQQREKVPDDYSVVDPEHKLIYRFIRTLFSSAQLTAECAIVTLVCLQCTSQIVGLKITLIVMTNVYTSCVRCTWKDCWHTLRWISVRVTGSELFSVPFCWPPKSGTTRQCGMSTTVRSSKISQWRTCEC